MADVAAGVFRETGTYGFFSMEALSYFEFDTAILSSTRLIMFSGDSFTSVSSAFAVAVVMVVLSRLAMRASVLDSASLAFS